VCLTCLHPNRENNTTRLYLKTWLRSALRSAIRTRFGAAASILTSVDCLYGHTRTRACARACTCACTCAHVYPRVVQPVFRSDTKSSRWIELLMRFVEPAGVTAERGPEKVKRGRRWGSAKAERGYRWSAGKRSAVLNFYPYRTRISSHNLPLVTVCIRYTVHMPSICAYITIRYLY